MNMTTTVEKHRFGKGDRGQNVLWNLQAVCFTNEHDNHSRRAPVWKWRPGGKMFVGHLLTFRPPIMMMMMMLLVF